MTGGWLEGAAGLWVLGGSLTAWCVLHSLLLWGPLRDRLEARYSLTPGRYRFWYSAFSLASLAPFVYLTWRLGGFRVWLWPGGWALLQLPLNALGLGLGWWAQRSFARGGFDLSGWEAEFSRRESPPHLVDTGAYGVMRHPMHISGHLILWCRSLTPADLVFNLVMSGYMLLGERIEEARLTRLLGDAYLDYRRRVPWLPFLSRGRRS